MSEPSFELREFEHVEAIPGRALLRIAAAPGIDLAASRLIVDGGDPVAPLPAPPGPPGVARVAFSIPADLVANPTAYELALGDGERVRLRAPSRRSAPVRTGLTGAGLGVPAPVPAATALETGSAEVIAELKRRLRAERDRRDSADAAAETSAAARVASETRLRSLDVELAEARADLSAVRDDLESARDALRTAQGEAELGQTRANHARAEAEAAETTLIQRAAEVMLLRQSLAERDAHAQHTYLEWEQITAELSAEVEVARQVAANFQGHARNLQLELADSRLELTSLRALREAHDQAVAAGSAVAGDAGDPAVVAAKLNAAAAALEAARARASEAESALAAREGELERLQARLPSA